MLKDKLKTVKNSLPDHVQLLAVSKTKPIEQIQELYDAGQRLFGENRVQELVEKQALLPKDIEWHLIGHLQRNKVKYIAPFVSLIHSVDSFELLVEIDKEAKKNGRVIDCLLQFYIADEANKFGFAFDEAQDIVSSDQFVQLENCAIRGVMGMATFTDDERQIRDEFRTLNNYFLALKSHFFKFNPEFNTVSMGMSGDYRIAIEEGSTLIRIGSSLFGER